ncbi:uncharacterized protein WCC33_014546 [Rhinophrynus dorsalis]
MQVSVTMSTTQGDTSRKRKKTKPHKLEGGKKRTLSNKDIEEVVKSCQEELIVLDSDGDSQEDQRRLSDHPNIREDKDSCPQRPGNPNTGETRGKGRPTVSKETLSSSPIKDEAQSAGENTPKRMRGRPKGSKNKYPSRSSLKQVIPGAPKLGRGRPRKILPANGTVTPKRPRGRPKGSLNKIPSARKLALSMGSGSGKKRGRPRKYILNHTTPTPKRPRGRPKIIRTSAAGSADELKGSSLHVDGRSKSSDAERH